MLRAMVGPGSAANRRAEQKEDALLIAAVAGGDKDALARLYDRYAGVMMALGLRVIGDRGETEDLLHDVFVELWRKAGDYDPRRGSVRAWMVLRMRSRALDRMRARKRRRTEGFTEGDADRGPGRAADPAAAADRLKVGKALASLPAEQRVVIELAYYQGLTTTEIAAAVSAPVGTVKSRMNSARAKLRVALGADEG